MKLKIEPYNPKRCNDRQMEHYNSHKTKRYVMWKRHHPNSTKEDFEKYCLEHPINCYCCDIAENECIELMCEKYGINYETHKEKIWEMLNEKFFKTGHANTDTERKEVCKFIADAECEKHE
jgi:hypothetical protein